MACSHQLILFCVAVAQRKVAGWHRVVPRWSQRLWARISCSFGSAAAPVTASGSSRRVLANARCAATERMAAHRPTQAACAATWRCGEAVWRARAEECRHFNPKLRSNLQAKDSEAATSRMRELMVNDVVCVFFFIWGGQVGGHR